MFVYFHDCWRVNRFLCEWNYYKNPINRHLAWFYYHVHSRSSLRFKETKPQLTECRPWKSEDYLENKFSTKDIPPWKLRCHLKRDHFKTKRVSQPSFFSGYVSLQGSFFGGKGILIIQNWALLGHYINFQYSFTSRVMIWTLNRPATCQAPTFLKLTYSVHISKKVRHLPSTREKLLHICFPWYKKKAPWKKTLDFPNHPNSSAMPPVPRTDRAVVFPERTWTLSTLSEEQQLGGFWGVPNLPNLKQPPVVNYG